VDCIACLPCFRTDPPLDLTSPAQEIGRLFCPRCGNATVEKVEVLTGPDGQEQYGVRRKHVLRGTRFSLPKPKVGLRMRIRLRVETRVSRLSLPNPRWVAEIGFV